MAWRAPAPLAERFWEKVDVRGLEECWEWRAFRLKSGYGRFGVGGRKGGIRLAHRVAHELCLGPIPEGYFVIHVCDNPPCVNPHHLRAATHDENMADMREKGRSRVGERNVNAKLSDSSVLEMRRIRKETGKSYYVLADDFGVSEMTAWHAVNGRSWSHVK